MLRLVLLDSSLELIPKEIANHPSVANSAKRRGKAPESVMLDVSLHYSAMKSLTNRWKRGRPDIVHTALLAALTSPELRPELHIHMLDSRLVWVNPQVRIPKNFNRFVGLMEELLARGRVPNQGPALMEIKPYKLKDLVDKYGLVIMHEKGEMKEPAELCHRTEIIGVGAFPHGEFSEEVLSLATSKVSISQYTLETHQAICRLISNCIKNARSNSDRVELV